MNRYNDDRYEEPVRSISLRDVADVVRGYRRSILLGVATVAALFLLGAIAALALKPSRTVTTLSFRLEFAGAERGEYPNGNRFSSAEIVSTPILLSVYNTNNLASIVGFQDFKTSIYVVEANPALEALEREYRAKLSDPKLSTVDRARLEQEFEQRKASIARSQYAISYVDRGRFRAIPDEIRTKILHDILATWAQQTVQNKGVVLYDLPILSSGIFEQGMLDRYDYIIALDILRSKIYRVIQNIDQLSNIPGAKVVRTSQPPQVTLAELRVRLEDQLRFRIDPLVGRIFSNAISKDPAGSINFFRARLRFNEIARAEAENRVEALMKALGVYQREEPIPAEASAAGGAQLGPMLDEGFIDRLIRMSGQQDDMEFRQELVEEIQAEALKGVPLQSEERYYRGLIESLQGYESRARTANAEELAVMRAEVDGAIADAIRTTDQVNEIYRALSQNLNPSTVLFSTTAPATTETVSVLSMRRIALLGLLLVLLSIPAAVILAFVHSRIAPSSDEAAVDQTHVERTAHATASAPGVEA